MRKSFFFLSLSNDIFSKELWVDSGFCSAYKDATQFLLDMCYDYKTVVMCLCSSLGKVNIFLFILSVVRILYI